MRPYTLLTSQFQQPTNKQDKQGQGLNKVVTCAGNLANHIANWREITTDPWILEAVSGLQITTGISALPASYPKSYKFF